jgi:hypothetical protein
MLRDGALRDAELHGQRADAESPLRHQLEDAQAHLDGQGSEGGKCQQCLSWA